jgi:hypothetical protein
VRPQRIVKRIHRDQPPLRAIVEQLLELRQGDRGIAQGQMRDGRRLTIPAMPRSQLGRLRQQPAGIADLSQMGERIRAVCDQVRNSVAVRDDERRVHLNQSFLEPPADKQ